MTTKNHMAEFANGGECLIVALRDELTLAEGIRWPLKGFRLGDNTYRDVGLGEWTGFYDWLRRSNGDLIGVRYSPLADNAALLEATRDLGYTRTDDSGGVEIYFDTNEVADEQRSCDQEFQYDAVFRSQEETWAIAFDMVGLTGDDRQRLHTIVRRWAPVTPLDLDDGLGGPT